MHTTVSNTGGFYAGIVRRPVALLVAFVTLIVIGVIAYQRIPVQLLPAGWSEPSLFAWIPNPGASAQENEELVARVVEEQLRTISGIEDLRSWSERDVVQIRLSFSGSVDMDLAKADVRDRIERAWPALPSTVETAQIWSESSDTLPITFFGIKLQGDPDRRDYLVEKVIQPRLEAVQGIGKVSVWGRHEDSVRILLDEDKVKAAGIDMGTVIRRLASDNFALPMGQLQDGGRELLVRSDMRFKTPEEIAAFPIGDGLKLADLGRVARVKKVQNELSRIDGAYAYFGMATKDSQSNVVQTSENLRAALQELEKDPSLVGQVSFMLFFLQGDMIQSALAQLKDTAVEGGLLAVVVLLVFLRRVRLTLCVALSIPVSALIAIAWEYFTGGTFNVMTMTGITLATGMLVDNAVVVVENIARLAREGASPKEAAAAGTREIALAVTLATLTTVVVFLPLIFMTEQAELRVIFKSLGMPLSTSLLASLLLAVVFTPVIVARMLKERSRSGARVAGWIARPARVPVRVVALAIAGLRRAWSWLVRLLFRMNRALLVALTPLRWPIAGGALAMFVGLQLLDARALGGVRSLEEFGVSLPRGSPLALFRYLFSADWRALASGLARYAWLAVPLALAGLPRWRRRPALGPGRPASYVPAGDSLVDMTVELNHSLLDWTLRHRLAASGLTALAFLSIAIPLSNMKVTAFGQDSSGDEIHFRVSLQGRFTLEEAEHELAVYEQFLEQKKAEYGFAHWSNRFDEDGGRFGLHFDSRKSGEDFDALEQKLKVELPRVAGHRLRFYEQNDSEGSTKSVARFTLLGPDSQELEHWGEKAQKLLGQVPGLSQVSTPLEAAPDQIEVSIDRDQAHALGVSSMSVENSIAYALGGFPLPRFQEEGREIPLRIEFDETETAGLPTLQDLSVFGPQGAVPLSSIAGISFAKGSRSIYRHNGKTSFTLEAKVDDPLAILPVTAAGLRALGELDLPRGYSVDLEDSALQKQEEEFAELRKAFALSIVLVFLLMGILFESVALPFSVLFTIPFAVLGSMWTLYLSGTPMDSMGWIGMIILAGVVVNNGIVLIDRIHFLSREGLERAQAVLVGCRQRVRPVLMTALTTVVGLLPMIVAEPPRDGFDYRALAAIVAGGLSASTFFTLWVVPLAYTLIDDLSTLLRRRARWWLRRPGASAARPADAAAGVAFPE